jgi:hypothetical protein
MLSPQTKTTSVQGTINTQNLVANGIATAGSAVAILLNSDTKTISIQVSGTYTSGAAGTLPGLVVQATIDNVNWVTLDGFVRISSGTLPGNTFVSMIPSAEQGIYVVKNSGYSKVRVCCISGAITGTATVNLHCSTSEYPDNIKYDKYSAVLTAASFTTLTSPFFILSGNNIKKVQLTSIEVHGTLTTALTQTGAANLLVSRCVAAGGGTTTPTTVYKFDSTSLNATATAQFYTAAPAPGATVEILKHFLVTGYNPNGGVRVMGITNPIVYKYDFLNKSNNIVLNSSTERLSLGLINVANVTACTLQVKLEWVEY